MNILSKYHLDLQNQKMWDDAALSDASHFDQNDYKLTVIAASRHFINRVDKNPEFLTKRINSVSLIVPGKSKTYLSIQAGFIVKVPSDCIFAAYQRDTYARNLADAESDNLAKAGVEEELARLNQNYGIRTPADMIKHSKRGELNEIDAIGDTSVLGDPNPKHIEITGVYIKTTKEKMDSLQFELRQNSDFSEPRTKKIKAVMKESKIKPVNEQLRKHYGELLKYSRAHNVPLVHIEESYDIHAHKGQMDAEKGVKKRLDPLPYAKS
jgi:hypothetical protein